MDKIIFFLIGSFVGGVTAFSICWSRKVDEDPDDKIKQEISDKLKIVLEDIKSTI